MSQNRNHKNGRYTLDGKLDRLCVCGHRLADHAHGSPHECFHDDGSGKAGDNFQGNCGCKRFKLAKTNAKA